MMIEKAIIVSYLFSFMSLIYSFIGFYGLLLNKKEKLNIIFFLMCISLSSWSFFKSVALSAHSPEIALYYYKLTSIGWATFYASILHFTTLIASNNKLKRSTKRNFYLLYFAVFIFIILMLFTNIGNEHFNIIESKYGYITLVPNNFTNRLVDVFALATAFLTILNLIKWAKNTKNDETRKRIIFLSMPTVVLIVLINLIVDGFMVRIMGKPIIQVTIFTVFLPCCAIFYVLHKSKIIIEYKPVNFNELLEDNHKEKLFYLMGYFYVIMSNLLYTMGFLDSRHYNSEKEIYLYIIFTIAVIHFFLNDILKKEKHQYFALGVMSFITMFSLYQIYDYTGAITVWAFFICFILISAVFKNRIYSYFITIVMIIFEFIHIYKGSVYAVVDSAEHVGRIFVIIMASIMVFYINYAYRTKNKDILTQVENRTVINNLSSDIIELNSDNLKEEIFEILFRINEGFSLSSSYFCNLNNDENSSLYKIYLVEKNERKTLYNYNDTIFSLETSWMDDLANEQSIFIPDVLNEKINLSKEVKSYFKKKEINGLNAIPIFVDNVLRGIQVFEFSKNNKNKFIYLYEKLIKNMIYVSYKKIENERSLFLKANFDDVTGLKKRFYFSEKVNKNLIKSPINNHFILYIDIDDFKIINETFGHETGDKILNKVARYLEKLLKESDQIGRLNGDEFIIFAYNKYSKKEIRLLAKNIINTFKEGISVDGNTFRLNLSIGISIYPDDGSSASLLLKNAELALQQSKITGYNKYHFCDKVDKGVILEKALYTDRLFKALEKNELVLYYQPQISCVDESVVGAEALIRWNSKEFGMVPPSVFIPIMERTGLITDVGDWIIEEGIKQRIKMSKMGLKPISLSINLSVAQFIDNSLIEKIEKSIENNKIDPSCLEFEITESVAINDNDFVMDTFNAIKEIGISIAIDDFGTGFSSLNRLQSLPINKLKIDKSFIDEIGRNSKKEAIVDVVIELAKSLGLTSVAEGVEEKYQVDYLKNKNCDIIQGYYYAKPMPAEDLEEFIRSKS